MLSLLKNKYVLPFSLISVVSLAVIYRYRFSSPQFKVITSQCLLGAMKNEKKNVLIVNVLYDKMPLTIGASDHPNVSIGRPEFEKILKENGNQIPLNIDLVILFCAAWSCSAGKGYYDELISRNVGVSKVIDYAGGIHEWATYSKINPDFFKVMSNDQETIKQLDDNDLTDLIRNTGHSYKNNLLIKEHEDIIGKMCSEGADITNNL